MANKSNEIGDIVKKAKILLLDIEGTTTSISFVKVKPAPSSKKAQDKPVPTSDAASLDQQIAKQGDLVRSLKAAKAEKAKVDEAVKALLELKGKYKASTGQDWKPGVAPAAAPAAAPAPSEDLDQQITKQGDLVRALKAAKAEKAKVDEAVKALLDLKGKYKAATGKDWKPGAAPAKAPAAVGSASGAGDLDQQITKQGDLVRSLKAAKAEKAKVDEAVKLLLELKGKYKEAVGQDWKPGAAPAPAAVPTPASSPAADLDQQITKQGDLVRSLKAAKAEKAKVDEAVKALLELKGKYKAATGQDWKPSAAPAPAKAPVQAQATPSGCGQVSEVLSRIAAQGDKVRRLKGEKADKAAVDAEVKTLLALKAEYKTLTGSDWSPNAQAPTPAPAQPVATGGSAQELSGRIAAQGNKVRLLKEQKADKAAVQAEVQTLLALKADYKKETGKDWSPNFVQEDWKPGVAPAAAPAAAPAPSEDLDQQITKQGDLVRALKAAKAEKAKVDEAVKALLDLKGKYKAATGKDWKPGAAPAKAPAAVGSASGAGDLDQQITKQGDLVRSLKAAKAEKAKVDEAVKLLLELKGKYKEAVGQDWKPGAAPAPAAVPTPASSPAADLDQQITKQGDLVRSLKAAKAEKAKVDEAVKALLELKGKYKAATGQDWKPSAAPAPAKAPVQAQATPSGCGQVSEVLSRIAAQGDKVRRLKGEKADKAAVDAEVKTLLALKAEYKTLTGSDWSPNAQAPTPAPAQPVATGGSAQELSGRIAAQGNKVRLLKEQKADKAAVQAEVQTLLALKADYKKETGKDWSPNFVQEDWKPGVAPAAAPAAAPAPSEDLDQQITKQGDLVRALKAAKAEKAKVDEAVKALLDLKGKYKAATGKDWKPGAAPAKAPAAVGSASGAGDLDQQITKQGDLVRSLKAAKAEKAKVDEAVKLLLELKGKYKEAVGQDWKPGAAPAPAAVPTPASSPAADLDQQITKQGDLVRSLKAAKAEKAKVDEAVKALLELKGKYKAATGQDWKPSAAPAPAKAPVQAQATPSGCGQVSEVLSRIAAQGDKVRRLKGEKADKAAVDAEVKTLLALKAEYKTLTGSDWSPNAQAPTPAPAQPVATGGSAQELSGRIAAQGNKVRLLKEQKADKAAVQAEVQTLLALKADYKKETGKDWSPNFVQEDWKPGVAPAAAPAAAPAPSEDLDQQITKQGDLVRALKAAKAEKAKVDEAVKALLDLKGKYKAATGKDWKPGAAPAPAAVPTPASSPAADLDQQITKQGDLVRSLKAAKAEKAKVDEAVKALLELKGKYKAATGQDWKPSAAPAPAKAPVQAQATPSGCGQVSEVLSRIAAQGDKVRRLKGEKADKAAVDAEVKTLLALKAEYKTLTGSDWSPNAQAPTPAPAQPVATGGSAQELSGRIAAQGNKVRLLKEQKADKAAVQAEVQTLLALKADYKKETGKDWSPNFVQEQPSSAVPVAMSGAGDDKAKSLGAEVAAQGDLVRDLKSKKADKATVDAAVKKLLDLKAQYQSETGTAYVSPTQPARDSKPKDQGKKDANAKPKENKPKEAKPKAKEPSPKPAKEESSSGVKKITRLGLEASKDTDLPEWYSQVITKSEMIEYYDISGCYILRPWSFGIWDMIRDFLSTNFKRLGVKDCYFPIFVSKAALEREKTHIADFAPEVAWVTHSGSSELAEHIAVRPTSETVMYPAYAKWVQSHRDLPLRLNQWNNVVRWEFKQPQPFLRTREFLWQEGHTAFLTQEEANEEVLTILDLYARVYEELLAIPVIKGRKTEKEKFAGGDYTTTVEAYIPASGRGIQGATSHHLGQNFSKMFDIIYDDPETQEKKYVYQNSWGLTTRTIGVMILVHGDDRGLVLPPRVAAVQAIVVPCGITASSTQEERKSLIDSCKEMVQELAAAGLRAEGDYRDNYSPGWKFNHWELKGVPIRVELGPKDIARGEIVAVRRLTGEKLTMKRATASIDLVALLERTHEEMLAKATAERDSRLSLVTKWDDFTAALERKHILLAPFCGEIPCEDAIKNDSARNDDDLTTDVKAPAMGAKSLCIPFKPPRELTASDRCIHPSCKNKPKFITLFGRSY